MAANAFNTASRIPRVFFDAVFASAISACFIPVFSEYLTRKGREPAFRFAGCFITVMGLLSAVLSVLGILFAGPRWSACLPTDMMPRRRSWRPPSPG